MQNNAAHHKLINVQAKLDAIQMGIHPIDPSMKPVRKGYIAEVFVKYQLERRGITYFDPQPQMEACDILIQGLSGKFYRCEIKATTSPEGVVFRKSKYVAGSGYSVHKYGADDKVDFFIAMDLTTEVLAIIPASVLIEQGWACLQIHANSKAAPYLWAFDQFV